MLEFDQVDRDQDALPYEQIAHMLRQAITSGELAPGERLPAETKLAKTFGVARMTVRRAVQELRDEGLLVPAPGRRVAVRAAPPMRELWPQEPGMPAEVTIPDFNAWGDAAPLVAQAENIRTRMYTLAGDLIEVGMLVGEPAVTAKLIESLAGIGLTQADVLGALAVRLHTDVLDSAHAQQVSTAMETARQTFAAACSAAQSAAETLRSAALAAGSDSPTPEPGNSLSRHSGN
ncbi:mercuric reductase/transcriptional regulator, fusion [Mycobacteroides abscessus subsp. abscessus]|uniref:Mercuric reductase/transcriptional regulator, fusion n=4 Tax=Mycobacteriaceae TaxID=1762 RepID=A0AB33TA68_9MYCO|nr:GntR family transcriptional regulator [Mycolicibacter kumamotonensis]PVB18037.1 GntR family transcriptional regulator [Mycobacteroides abscessus]SHS92450.1 mercuric reductase/transcriptional regulator, fusion [Mycobacteroides abscessus subsp. abscessus]RIR96901.1 GntR family transcriptional regulator [Mycobacteroides abscessus]CPT43018.1 mercuric reductase/transcriptional regulator%2C fusion [Mycobacteroides abscessus]